MKKILIIIGLFILVFIGIVTFRATQPSNQASVPIHPTASLQKTQNNTISYKGENGIDALTLLKKRATVEQDHSGLVVGINGVKPTGHTYWAFYVNGKLASVGPAQYVTKNGDTIVWKIEKY